MCGFLLLLCVHLACLTRCCYDAFPVWIIEFCDQLFGSVASFSIQCHTTHSFLILHFVGAACSCEMTLIGLLQLCIYLSLSPWLVFSQNGFLIAPDRLSVWHASVFEEQWGWVGGSKQGKYGLLPQCSEHITDDGSSAFRGFSPRWWWKSLKPLDLSVWTVSCCRIQFIATASLLSDLRVYYQKACSHNDFCWPSQLLRCQISFNCWAVILY